MTDPFAWLADLSALAETADPGPWQADSSEIYGPDNLGRGWVAESLREGRYIWQGDRNADFIAAARDAVPRLVGALQAVLALCDGDMWNETDAANVRAAVAEWLGETP